MVDLSAEQSELKQLCQQAMKSSAFLHSPEVLEKQCDFSFDIFFSFSFSFSFPVIFSFEFHFSLRHFLVLVLVLPIIF